MPRQADPANAVNAEAMRTYRRRLSAERKPEVDAVDTALASALAVFLHLADKCFGDLDEDGQAHVSAQREAVVVIEKMASRILVSKGYAKEHARKKVGSRIRRLDAEAVALKAGLIASQR